MTQAKHNHKPTHYNQKAQMSARLGPMCWAPIWRWWPWRRWWWWRWWWVWVWVWVRCGLPAYRDPYSIKDRERVSVSLSYLLGCGTWPVMASIKNRVWPPQRPHATHVYEHSVSTHMLCKTLIVATLFITLNMTPNKHKPQPPNT